MRFRRVAVLLLLVLIAPLALAQQTKPSSQTPPASPKATAAPSSSKQTPPPGTVKQPADSALAGNAKAGAGKVAVCSACHGPDGNSSIALYPKLAGQNESYIVSELRQFKSGARKNPIMHGFAAQLTDRDMHDIGAYYAEQKTSPGTADESQVKPGQKLYREGDRSRGIPACMACHGPDGAGNPGAGYPHLAGQHTQYVVQVLKAWHDGDTWGDSAHEQIMPDIAHKLSAKDIVAVASYIQGLHTATPAQQQGTASAP